MPELPEVETTRRGVAPWLEDQVVTACRVRNPRLRIPVTEGLDPILRGQRLHTVRRRAKYLLLDFESGSLIIHLGMSGSLRIFSTDVVPGPHDHVDVEFGAHILRFRDPRRFGMVVWVEGDPLAHPLLARLGPEPLSDGFDGAHLFASTRGIRIPIKQAIMDAKRVVGVGNIYASESLFRARIHPLAPAGRLGKVRCTRLVATIRETLADAIAAGGSSLRDFVGSDGMPGYFQQHYFVYGRDGAACRICASVVRRAIVAQRATFWCPRCQFR